MLVAVRGYTLSAKIYELRRRNNLDYKRKTAMNKWRYL